MLTTLYYYGHYRNFVTRNSGPDSNRAWLKNDNQRVLPRGATVQLNKSLSNRVADYAKGLSSSIVGLKDSAKMFLYDAHAMNRNGYETYLNHLRWIEEDLHQFIHSYNTIQDLSFTTNHSPTLKQYASSIRTFATENNEILTHLGIISGRANTLTYHGFGNTTDVQITREVVNAFRDAYDVASGFLDHPLAHHMEFKGLNYYYNYTIGQLSENSFRLIDQGLLIDIAV